MKLPWIAGGAAVFCFTVTLFARQGVVTTQDGKRFEGDVTDRGATVDIVTPDPKKPGGVKVTLPKGSVKDIIYADHVGELVKLQLAKLDKQDVRGRVTLAQFAMKNGAYEAARDVLEDARAIEPGNQEVQTLLETVNAHINMGRTARPATAPAATRPTTAPATQANSEAPKREVTPEEINRIKQLEWNQKDPIRVRVDADVRNNYIRSAAITPAEFAKLSPEQQAIQIMNHGKKEWAAGVHIMTDPISVAEYHKIQRVFVTGCATSGCHGGPNPKGGNFYLYTADNPAAYYTNFLTLQTFSHKVSDIPRPLVDREHPEESLLLQYMLPVEISKSPHPKAQNYKGAVRSANDPRFQQVRNWVMGLNGIHPDYDIDLTKEAPKKEGEPKRR